MDKQARTHVTYEILGGAADGSGLTGSCILLTIKQGKEIARLLIDSGLIQCGPKDFYTKNIAILKKLKPELLDWIIITHAHTDHIGGSPILVKKGLARHTRIICTKATAKIMRVMLEDSANIQLENAKANKKQASAKANKLKRQMTRDRFTLGNYDRNKRKNKKALVADSLEEILYTTEDVEKTCNLIKNDGHYYQEWIKLAHTISLKFYESGHVLGGAICVIRIETRPGFFKYWGFSGDLGRHDGIILPPPAMIEEPISYWTIESTYGGKTHPERAEEITKLIDIVKEAVPNKQKIIIPSFALERTQEILYLLTYYMQEGMVPKIPIYLDAPMASKITNIYAESWEDGMFADQDKLKFNPFNPEENHYFKVLVDHQASASLIKEGGPYIAIAGSGMCDAGRVREHLREGLGNPNTNVCLVGYMVEGSLGRKLKDGFHLVKMNGKPIIIRAKIVCFDSLSAHADQPFLASYTQELAKKKMLKKVFIVHGEKQSSSDLAAYLAEPKVGKKIPLNNIIIPNLYDKYEFDI